ncbi:extracellular signal-regulated kinase 2 [Halyomorpha halys]|uniref:extracellular signal-regulated kinase 2 n=1 Tax=Halyomorpha halys TaxID=286706 RepID=UPI0006D4E56D|nr:extracellular signal-regulated kinase 2-like [Halyomorpha halys]XP_014282303.1 extracellular signal-regulated kinase 2-like [Halyomorpha halys]
MKSSKTPGKEIDKSISPNILHYYVIDRRVGQGAYGIVWKAYKRNTSQPVALKKIFDAFRNTEDAQRTFREVSYLKAFKGHPNIIQLLNIHRATNNSDLYLVFEYMNIDLHNYITSGNKLDDNQVRYIIYQILKALKFMHSGNVVHRDLKPSNILLNMNCECKIADFGLARSLGETRHGTRNPLTDYVATRWYRAPEILLGSKRYTQVVDLWSLGCVLAEMVTGSPMFPGDSTTNQLELIISTVAHDDKEVEALSRLGVGRPRIVKGLPLKERLRSSNCECIDLASRMLRLDPAQRISAQQALRHPFVCSFRSRRGEPVIGRAVQAAISDNSRLTVQDYRVALYNYEERKPRTFLPSNLPGVTRYSKSRNNVSLSKKPFSSEPENTSYKARIYESTRYPPLSTKTCFSGNFQSKVSIRH